MPPQKTPAPRKPASKAPRLRAHNRRGTKLRWLRWLLLALFLLAVLGTGTLVAGYWYYSRDLPDFQALAAPARQVTRVYAKDGTPIAEFYRERRTVVERKAIPQLLVDAFLSAEDADFYTHEGLDYPGMVRAMWNSLRAGHLTGSGSTITQQTVKNLLLTQEKSFRRKARELILARRIEDALDKDEILTLYLNTIYFGHGRYGVQEAAQYFWAKDVGDLTLPEAAMMAGIVQSPERLSPRKHPERARQRRHYVLAQMLKNGKIDKARADAAERADFDLADPPVENLPEAAWFVEEVRQQVTAALGADAVLDGGLRIDTTLDLARQRAADAAVAQALRAIDQRQGYGRKPRNIEDVDAWRTKRAKALGDKPPEPGAIVEAVLTEAGADLLVFDLGVGTAHIPTDHLARYRDKDGKLPWRAGDLLKLAVRSDGPRFPEPLSASLAVAPQAAFVVLDPQTREVEAIVGGDERDSSPYNRAVLARRQPGSTFKPFVWGAALETRRYTPVTRIVDAPETFHLTPGKWWQPENYSGKYEGPVALRDALARSINSIAVKLIHDVGPAAVQDFARKAGITSPLVDNLTLALGSSEVTPLELANAYATIAADGRWAPPRFVRRILGPDGQPIETPLTTRVESEQRLSPDTAYVLRSMMRTAVTAGTASGAMKGVTRPVAGKTGTTNKARDAWFVGLLPEAVMVAWIGFDDNRPLGRRETGGAAAVPLVRSYLEAAENDGPAWGPPPDGVVVRQIDPATGLLAHEGTDKPREEPFLAGTEPTQVAPAAGEIGADTFMMDQMEGSPEAEPAPEPDPDPTADIAVEDEDRPQ